MLKGNIDVTGHIMQHEGVIKLQHNLSELEPFCIEMMWWCSVSTMHNIASHDVIYLLLQYNAFILNHIWDY